MINIFLKEIKQCSQSIRLIYQWRCWSEIIITWGKDSRIPESNKRIIRSVKKIGNKLELKSKQ